MGGSGVAHTGAETLPLGLPEAREHAAGRSAERLCRDRCDQLRAGSRAEWRGLVVVLIADLGHRTRSGITIS